MLPILINLILLFNLNPDPPQHTSLSSPHTLGRLRDLINKLHPIGTLVCHIKLFSDKI